MIPSDPIISSHLAKNAISFCIIPKTLTHLRVGNHITLQGQLFSFYKFCLFELILYVPSTIFQLCRDRSSWVEPVLS